MAQVRSFSLGTRNCRHHTTAVDCEFQIVYDSGGGRVLQLSTFGSDERSTGPKVSQTIQLDEQRARELAAILAEAFPDV